MPSFFSEYEGSHWVVTGHLHLYHPGPASCPRRMLSSAGRSLPGAVWIFSSGFSFLVHFLADIQSYFQIPKLRLVLLVSPGSNAQQEPLAGSQLTTGHLPVAGGSCPQHQLGTGPGDHPALSCCFRAQGLPETQSLNRRFFSPASAFPLHLVSYTKWVLVVSAFHRLCRDYKQKAGRSPILDSLVYVRSPSLFLPFLLLNKPFQGLYCTSGLTA